MRTASAGCAKQPRACTPGAALPLHAAPLLQILLFLIHAVFLLQTEDRPVVKERVTRMREHHPVEKEFVVSSACPACLHRPLRALVLDFLIWGFRHNAGVCT